MSDNVENLVLELLKAIRQDVQTLKADNRDIKMRLASIEGHMATFHMEVARHSTKFDEIDERIERLERRMELRD